MTSSADTAKYCPICGKVNNCRNLAGKPQGACWCSKENFPKALFNLVPADQLGKSCICKDCLDRHAQKERA